MRFDDLARVNELAARFPDAAVVRLVALHGFGGGERAADLAIMAPEGTVGAIVGPGVVDRLGSDPTPRLARVEVSDPDAEAHGLACGGWAEVLVHPASWLPPLGEVAGRRVPFVLTTVVGDDGPVAPIAIEVDPLVRPGVTVRDGVHRQAFVPRPRFVVVGDGPLVDELRSLGTWLDVEVDTGDVTGLGPLDGVLVLTHDHERATPVLASALGAGVGYVAALGSRATQHERVERLRAVGVDARRLFGPAGLDLGSRSVRETALSILAEWLAVTRGRSGAHLAAGDGPING